MDVYTSNRIGSLWLPYSIAIIGIVCSLLLAYILWRDIQANFNLLDIISDNLPWLTAISGSFLSIFLAKIIRMAQIAKQRAIVLDKINEDLKKEIYERTHAEETKQKLEVALLQGQKLQAMGTLAGGIAHDFNNLLYAIIGYTEMAREDVDKETLLYKNLGKILEATHRGQELVARILAFSRRQHHRLERINLNESIEAALSLLRPTIPSSVIINFSAEMEAVILANQTQIHQVFVNIINNAVDAMDGEGQINIHISRVKAGDILLLESPGIDDKDMDYCKISITDTGHGMDKQTMERIFEPFYTTKEVGKGTGLGLSIVHTIVKEHKGDITVTSQLGRGTCFIILLPENYVF
jgi:signal transduction histidine kinase